ncbi:hypothetical protein EV182_002499 [Spiromyces aspiralis]|uniref:Uncharacterized protein n=1 Tax=Spiromyces aspiralis TaxID=68401 RepID=A0ACC1HFM9_9FUNG|nr:hypothetical protein EV182_002499 [Spiromyces aspiralis]
MSRSPTLSDLFREHQSHQVRVRKETEHLKKEAQAAIGELSDTISDQFASQLEEMMENQRQIEELATSCAALANEHAKSNQKWTRMVQDLYTTVKELGDVQNWAQVIERDMRDIALTLKIAHTGKDPAPKPQQKNAGRGEGDNGGGGSTLDTASG